MAKNDFAAEAAKNYEQKCLVVLVLDVSGSMNLENRIGEMNKGLQEFYNDIRDDETASQRLEISIITFSNEARTIQEPSLVTNFQMPTLTARGTTAMVTAVNEAIDKVEARKQWYKNTGQTYFRPWIVLMTDGEPDDDQDVEALAARIKRETEGKHFQFMPIGVGDANMAVLTKLQGNMPALKLEGTKFMSFFQWLSSSMDTITKAKEGETVDLSQGIDDWMTPFKIEI